ncbi:MAG: thioredoxin domain-containing protein, partial [Haloplanus sp.]
RELQHPEGGFYSTLDAQSPTPDSRLGEGEAPEDDEGAFYVWTPAEVRAATGSDPVDTGNGSVDSETAADLFCDRYGVESGGNFEGGTTVLTVAASYEELAETHALPVETVERVLLEARTRAFDARADRPRPARDEKVLAGWNGLAISGIATGARTLDPGLAGTATDALEFVREHLYDAETGRLTRRFKAGDVQVEGYLDDYAFLAKGAFDCYQVTGEVDHLAFAVDLARVVREEFWDDEAGTLYYTPEHGEGLVTRPQELNDQSTPSSLGVAASLFDELDLFVPDEGFGAITERLLATHADRIRSSPLEHASLVLAADAHARGPVELTLAADEMPASWRETLAARPLLRGVVAPRPASDGDLDPWLDALGVDAVPPIWANREAADGQPTAYACRDFTCSPPQRDLDAALDWLADR